jgi:hypothetical protein
MMSPIAIVDLPAGHLEKPYTAAEDESYCDICNWYGNFRKNANIWLCEKHARELGHLW